MQIMISASTHRSGSTLLQRIMNSRPGTLIWGEHDGCLINFYKIYNNAMKYTEFGDREEYFSKDKDPNTWIATMTPSAGFAKQAILNSIKAFFETLYAEHAEGHDIIGFKEVRYGPDEIRIFRECYPDAKIILLVRNPINVWKSAIKTFWYEEQEGDILNFASKWNKLSRFYYRYSKEDKNTFLFRYEDIISREPHTIIQLLDIAQLSNLQLEQVLQVKLDGSSKYDNTKKEITNEEKDIIVNECFDTMALLNYN